MSHRLSAPARLRPSPDSVAYGSARRPTNPAGSLHRSTAQTLSTTCRLAAAAVLAALLCPPAPAAGNNAGVRDYLDLARRHEADRGCTRSPSNSSAIGYYQMTLAALRDIDLKDDAGNWLDNEWGITSDDEFQCHRAANDAAMKQFTEKNWAILGDAVKDRIGRSAYGVVIDAASLLAGAHFLGARGMNDFILCGMHAACLSERAVVTNGGDPDRIHRKLMKRMRAAAGLNVTELTDGS